MCKFCDKIQKLSISENEVLIVKVPIEKYSVDEVSSMAEALRAITNRGIIIAEGISIEIDTINNVIDYLEE